MRSLRKRLGRRGAALLILGVGKVCWGIGYVAAPTTDRRGLGFVPIEAWAALWVVGGTVAFASAFLPEGRDRWGWVAAVMPPLATTLGYTWAALTEDYPRGWVITGWYLTSHVLFILWAASVAEYAMPNRRCRHGTRRAPPLWLLGVGAVCWGVGHVAAPATDRRGLALVLGWADLTTWGTVWVAVGVLTFAAGFLPQGPDRWGFAGAVVLPGVWALSYGWSAVDGDYARGGFLCVWYLCSHVGMALWAASVPEYQVPALNVERQG